jgi:RNA polymerase sigma-70 factor (ECF subfamily)
VIQTPVQDIVEDCRRGDRDAFRALFESHRHKVYSIALRYTGNSSEAMDISQDVFVKLFSHIGDFLGRSNFDTWLYRMVVNCCLDHRRKFRRLVPLFDSLRQKDRLARDTERSQTSAQVQKAVAKLPSEMRLTVVLRYTEGLSYDEIAEVFGCSIGTVASRLNRAHKELAKRLKGMENWNV